MSKPRDGNRGALAHSVWGWLRERELWLVAAAVPVYFAPVLFFGRVLFFRDIYLLYLPRKIYQAQLMLAGELPLWETPLNAGQPFFANPGACVLFPGNLLYMVVDPYWAFGLEVALHVLAIVTGGYLLGRALELTPPAAAVTAAILGLNGFTLSVTNNLQRLLALECLPFVLLFWHLFWTRRQRRWLVLAVVAQMAQLHSGGAAFVLAGLAVLGLWTLVYPYRDSGWPPRLARLLVVQVVVVGLLAVQLVPAAGMVRESSRGEGLDVEASLQWSVDPRRLPELVVPGFLGRTDTLDETDYWGRGLVDLGFPYILSLYIGLLPLALALAGGMMREAGPLPRRFRGLLLAVLVVSVVVAVGRFVPGFAAFYRALPLMHLVRYPVKLMVAAVVPLALLAGAAYHALVASPAPSRRAWLPVAVATAALALPVLVMSVVLAATPEGGAELAAVFFGRGSPEIRAGLLAACGHAVVVAVLGVLLVAYRVRTARAWPVAAGIVLVAADLLVAGVMANPTAPRELYERVPGVVAAVRDQIDEGRMFRDGVPAGLPIRAPSNELWHLCRWNLDILKLYLSHGYGIAAVFHDDFNLLAPRPMRELTELVREQPWSRRIPVLSAGSVRWVVTHERLAEPELEMVAQIPNASPLAFFLYHNRNALPWASWADAARRVASVDEALEQVGSERFDPWNEVVVVDAREEPPASNAAAGGGGEEEQSPLTLATEDASVEVIDRGSARWTVRLSSPRDGYLVISESFDPGWRMEVDGVEAEVLRANVAFQAVAVAAGEHTVKGRYLPRSWQLGVAVSLVALTAFGLLLRWRRFVVG